MEQEQFVIRDGELVKFTGDDETVVIPDGVTSIGASAFSCLDDLVRVVILLKSRNGLRIRAARQFVPIAEWIP